MGVYVVDHPPKSPDLNAIEHFWFKLKDTVHVLHPEILEIGGSKLKKMQAIKEAVRHAIEYLTTSMGWILLRQLIESMPRRIDAVYFAGGRQTRY